MAVRCRPPDTNNGEHASDIIVSMSPATHEIYLLDQENTPWQVDVPLWSQDTLSNKGNPFISQAELYDKIGRPLLFHALDGYNSTLMAYGATGSGKTYTMIG